MAKNTVGSQLAEILDEYGHALDDMAQKEIRKIARETAAKLRDTSPANSGDYAQSWTSTTDRSGLTIVYNKERHGRLTHLLEYGHLIRNKNGTFGRAPAKPHIKPVEEWANEELVRRVEAKIKGGLT